LTERLDQVRDTRASDRIVYPTRFLVWAAWMPFLLKLGSRRAVRFELDSPIALENLNRLSGSTQHTRPHSDTLEHFLGHVPPGESPKLRRDMVYRLIRMKALDDARVLGFFLVVVDGTGLVTFGQRHCAHCLERTAGGQTYYAHQVLEAKLVTPQGLAISIASQFIENADPKADKQDCELKAFARLAQQLKRDFPQLRLCLCLDALYANGTALTICENNRWAYLIVFKEGSLPEVWQEYQTLLDLCPNHRRTHPVRPGVHQRFAWVNDLTYTDTAGRPHRFDAFCCHETEPGASRFFAWITNIPVIHDNVIPLANDGGRNRWKIENEGFNMQKNGGYHLEHAYSRHDIQMGHWYVLLQIAHMILQLVERGSLLSQTAKRLFGSLRALARRLAESLRHCPIPPDALGPAQTARIQIRLRPP